MALHSRWSSGDLIFYDGTQDILTIKNGTGGIEVGTSSSGVPFQFYGNITYPSPQEQTSSTGETITLTSTSNRIQFLSSTATGFNMEVPLSTGTGVPGIEFKLINSSCGTIAVYAGTTASGSLIATIGKLEGATLISASTGWGSIIGST